MTDRARENKRLAWLIVGTSALLSLTLAGVLLVWAYGRAKQWVASQPRTPRPTGDIVTTPVPPTFPDLDDPDELRKDSGDGGDWDGGPPPAPRSPGPLSVAPGSARPLGDVARWVTAGDYPPAALRAGLEGRARVTLTVSGAGRPIACRVAMSSGHDSLDGATCDAMMLRGRFNPPGGTRRWTSPYIRWRIPEG